MNLHQNVVCPSEEPFAIFFYKKYAHKVKWTEKEILNFIEEFWLIAEKNLDLFFTSKEKLFNQLIPHKDNLNYRLLCNIIYLQFFEPKPKDEISIILDKQIKYFFYLKTLIKLYPESKFIILVRDPRVNAIRKKNRKLNAGKSPLYLSALWNNTYKNIEYLTSHKKEVLIVKYEDLVSNPETILKNICQFLNIDYNNKMLQTDGVFESFINIQKDKIDDSYLNYLKDFQSSLFQKVNKEKISLQDNEIDDELNDKIVTLTKPLLEKFGYDTTLKNQITVNFSINDYLQIIKSYLYRPLLIQFYLAIPISIKLIIKKIRK